MSADWSAYRWLCHLLDHWQPSSGEVRVPRDSQAGAWLLRTGSELTLTRERAEFLLRIHEQLLHASQAGHGGDLPAGGGGDGHPRERSDGHLCERADCHVCECGAGHVSGGVV